MNVMRFVGRSSREAMARVRATFGDDAVVLSNRACEEGIEIVAMAADDVGSAPQARAALAANPAREQRPSQPRPAPRQAESFDEERPAPAMQRPADAGRPMSTVSFEDYVRDRLARRQAEVTPPARELPRPAPVPARRVEAMPAERPLPLERAVPAAEAPRRPPAPAVDTPSVDTVPVERVARPVPDLSMAPAPRADEDANARLRDELLGQMQELRHFISEQVSTVSWLDGVRRSPIQHRLLKRLIDNGFSPALSRRVVAQLPSDFNDVEAERWLHDVIARNIRTDANLLTDGGVFAVVGPTGVGKTTTTAKIAAHFALRHGPQSIGLITVDHYRVGAHEQLRAFGRILGVPVHTAHDAETLADFLDVFSSRRLVLIDTVGIGQRDERVQELLASLASPKIRRLLVLNAASQPATIEDVARAYHAQTAAGVVISKLDEAVTLGGVLDCAVRHRLPVLGLADGQRVPEDWHRPDAAALARRALEERARSVFSVDDAELASLCTASAGAVRAGGLHA